MNKLATEEKRAARVKAVNRIEYLLAKNCRLCPQHYKYDRNHDACNNCPVLDGLREQAAELDRLASKPEPKAWERKISEEEYRIAEMNGLRRSTVKNRIFSNGWTIERAITEKLDKERSLRRRKGAETIGSHSEN